MILVLADAHLPHAPHLKTHPGWRDLQRLLQMLDTGDALWTLGDLFDCWIEYGGGRYPRHYAPVVEALLESHRRGVQITLIPGNHDAWMYEFWPRQGLRVARGPVQTAFFGVSVLLAHGHEWPRPSWYQAALTHPGAVGLYRRLVPEDWGLWIAARIASLLRARGEEPDQNLRDPRYRAAWMLAASRRVQHVICAHTHRPKRLPLPYGGWYWNTGAWMHTRTLLVWDESGPRLCRWSMSGLKPWGLE
ncbi:MAG: UDP-2,3-diacylglucosamine diphosphatase [Bacteroidota bacterium]|nr:UDP-2,3-diacylglucosamine diphosphatase [Bacteroidota bacterium]MDW8137727.1 UDP-2,3-diacylglucosamine diphosphatase [Bacteroidota bacterium]